MPDTDMTIVGWTKVSFIDFPGAMATVLFSAGCNLRCPYCHNPGVVFGGYPAIDVSLIKEYLTKRSGVIEGVVFSGGEPTIHAELPAFIESLRSGNLKIKLDTNGLLPEMIERCRPDYCALDIKTHPSRYRELGCGCTDVEARLRHAVAIVKSMGNDAEVRIPAVPRFVDEEAIRYFTVLLAGVARVWLQPYRRDVELLDGAFAALPPYPPERIERFKAMLAPFVGVCEIRGE